MNLLIDTLSNHLWFSNIKNKDSIKSLNHVNVNGVDYATEGIIVLETGPGLALSFGEILNIFVKNEIDVFIVVKKFIVDCWVEHLHAYKVEKTIITTLENIDNLPYVHPCLVCKKDNELFIVTKYRL